jgi:hypothetical protein
LQDQQHNVCNEYMSQLDKIIEYLRNQTRIDFHRLMDLTTNFHLDLGITSDNDKSFRDPKEFVVVVFTLIVCIVFVFMSVVYFIHLRCRGSEPE